MVGKFTLAACLLLATIAYTKADPRLVCCYYDSKSHAREGQVKMQVSDLNPALSSCTHLVYGHAGINKDTYKIMSLDESFDITKNNYRIASDLKKIYLIRVMLSVGGGADNEDTEKYMELLETAERRLTFINSAVALLKTHGFDGLNLGWQFPATKPKKVRSTLGSLWHGFKKKIGLGKRPVDEKEAEHREQYTALIREMKNAFKHERLLLSMSVLPNVNSTIYYDAKALDPYVDWVNIMGFDFQTPKRNPKEADYPAPLYELHERNPQNNVDRIVGHWLDQGFPSNKLVVGVPAFGRAWKMTENSAISGVPPFETDGPAEEGPYTKQAGLLSYPEICVKMNSSVSAKGPDRHLRKVEDPRKRYGTYAFCPPEVSGDHGIWVGYDDPDTVGNKASYVKAKGLAGVAIHDLSMDDFRGLCSSEKFPIVHAAKNRLL